MTGFSLSLPLALAFGSLSFGVGIYPPYIYVCFFGCFFVPAIRAQAEKFDSILKHFKLPDFGRARLEVDIGFRHIQHQSAANAFHMRMAGGIGIVSDRTAGI